jgi:hypothetical protein
MIVNSLKDGWEIIYQRSHANLAAMLLNAWRSDAPILRRTETIIATAQHDDQEMFWSESVHLTDIGAPLDFTQGELDTARMQAQLVIDNAQRQGLWIALLISMHNSFLYEPKRGTDQNLDAFLDHQLENQKMWRRLLSYSKAEAETSYAFVRWADQMSLLLCRGELPERGRAIDVMPGPDGEMIRASLRDDGSVALDPWVFEQPEVTVSVEVRRLHQLRFDSEAQFIAMLHDAKIEVREWTLRR